MSNGTDSTSRARGNRPPFHKRQYIVDKPFQYRLIGTLLAIWLANSLFFTLVLYFFFEQHVVRFYELVPRAGMYPLLSLSTLFSVSILFIFTFGLIVLGVIALYMSNQIAGPLYRMKQYLARVGRGEWNVRLSFRQGDFLRDVPGVFNAMLDELNQRARADIEALRKIENSSANDLKRLVRAYREELETRVGVPLPDGRAAEEPAAATLGVS